MNFIIIAIARNINEDDLIPAFEASMEGGIKHLEVTMNTDNASKIIKKVVSHFKSKANIGAGTVVTMKDLHIALDAGAKYIVCPIVNKEIIKFCFNNKIPVFPGAFTPTEIYKAWESGATMVKVFPVGSAGGPKYIRQIKGPFNNIKLLACSGVTIGNFKDYLDSKIDGIAIGGQLFDKEAILNKDYNKIKDIALEFTRQVENL